METATSRVLVGDVLDGLRSLPDGSVRCCVTSPPYWGLRDYGTAEWEGGDQECDHKKPANGSDPTAGSTLGGGKKTTGHSQESWGDKCRKCGATRIDHQIGLERTPEEYVAKMVEVFREVRRVLAEDGTCWINLGDSYAATSKGSGGMKSKQPTNAGSIYNARFDLGSTKPKDLVGIPWKTAQALQAPYYTGHITRERDRVWLAAMIDAEGTICGFDHDRADDGSHRSGLHLTITNTSTALLDEAARIWPTSQSRHQRPHTGHLGTMDSWRWIVHGIDNKMAALRELYPYLIGKRQQAVVGYTLLTLMADAKRLGHSPQKDAVLAKRRVLTGLLSDLNHQRPVTLPNWLVEPPSLFEPGFYLRQDIIWSKPNPMPESVTDRCTKAHEYVFLLSKAARYYYDAGAVAEDAKWFDHELGVPVDSWGRPILEKSTGNGQTSRGGTGVPRQLGGTTSDGKRNRRSVWHIATQPFPGAHFAVMPEALVEPCVLAGSAVGDTVLDPFAGSGTVGVVALRNGRHFIGCELNPEYAKMAETRIARYWERSTARTEPEDIDQSPLF